ncbi:MAG TPA: hypothetical protein VIT38_03450 [Allosphingosinicella sp.]|jgi:hypothetical protein
MGSKLVKMLLGIVVSVAIFGGVAIFVMDLHPLGGSAAAYERQQACVEGNRYSGESNAGCYSAYDRESAKVEWNERLVAGGAGVAAVGLFWLLLNFLYLRPRRRRAEAAEAAA